MFRFFMFIISERGNIMTKVSGVGFNSVEHAIKNNFVDMASIRLKDGASLKIMAKDDRFDAFVVKKGDVLCATGSKGDPSFVENGLISVLNKMQRFMEKGKNIFDEYSKSLTKVANVK